MRDRCEKEWHVSYKHYGAKGIQCKVDVEDFVEWFLKESKGNMSLQVDRIDSSGHYELSNMRLVSQKENVGKCNKEKPRKYKPESDKRRVSVKIGDKIFRSLSEAGMFFKGNATFVKRRLKINETMPDGTKIELIE